MFKSISLNRFRGINKLKIEDIKQFNLFVGQNNCGKTTLLEALYLLINPTNAELALKINAFRKVQLDDFFWKLFFHNLDIDAKTSIEGELDNPIEKRIIEIKPNFENGSQLIISNEEKQNSFIDLEESYSESKLIANGLNLKCISKIGKKKIISRSKIFLKADKINWSIPEDKEIKDLKGMFLNYGFIFTNIGVKFDKVQTGKGKKYLIDIIKKIDYNIKDLVLGKYNQIMCDIGLDTYVPISIMGDGTLRSVSIILSIMNIKDGIVLVDEIDNGLHYTTQKIAWKAIFETAKKFNVQIFATAHSMETVNAFYSEYQNLYSSELFEQKDDIRLFRIERHEEKTKYVSYNHRELESSFESRWEMR